jgi:DEAD/DEAH box helicase domain-containing protein
MDIIFFDLETQYLFSELGMNDYIKDPSKLKIAIAGIKTNSETLFFDESKVIELLDYLKKADLIVGHNLLGFDYNVLQHYFKENIKVLLKSKTFDIMFELQKLTGCKIALNNLGDKNIGLIKNCNTLEIPKMWREGKHEEVQNYLLNDLIMTEKIFNYGKNFGKFKYTHKNYNEIIGEKEVNVPNWGIITIN